MKMGWWGYGGVKLLGFLVGVPLATLKGLKITVGGIFVGI